MRITQGGERGENDEGGKGGGGIPPNLTLYSKANPTVFIAENFNFFILKIFLNMSTVRNVLPDDDFMGS